MFYRPPDAAAAFDRTIAEFARLKWEGVTTMSQGYIIKWAEETAWAVFFAAAIVLFQTLSNLGEVQDWRTWALGLGTAVARVAAAVMLNQLRKLKGA